jgi:hypothetical protein
MPADVASAGISALGRMGVASDSTNGASGGSAACVGRVVLVVAIPTRGGDKARGWIVGVVRSFGRPTG